MGKLSKTYLFGWLPLDGLLHFLVGLVLTLIFRKKGFDPKKSVAIIFVLQLIKEGFDSFKMTATWEEAARDTLFTMIFPVINWIIFLIKRKAERS